MIPQRSTGELMETLTGKGTYERIQEEISADQYDIDLSGYLHGLAEERGLKPADIMRDSGLRKSYFYQLFDGKRKNPSRDMMIQMGFGFRFTLDEMQEFLKHLNIAQLYPKIPRDGVIIYALHHGLSIVECDLLLADNDEEPLSKE